MATVLLIVHGLLAVLLLGAITHQVLAGYKSRSAEPGFFSSVLSARGQLYTKAVVVLFPLVTLLGGIIYLYYRLEVRVPLEAAHHRIAVGAFELKEHFVVLGLASLPGYWYLWQQPEDSFARRAVTLFIALSAWWGFFVGHILNNLKGFGSL